MNPCVTDLGGLEHETPHLSGMSDGHVGHELDSTGDANVVDAGVHHA